MFVYRIKNIVNGKVYIGQSVNAKRRWVDHKAKLNRNQHPNEHLQSAWQFYNARSFEFDILEQCTSKEMTNQREVYYINEYKALDREFGYNIRTGGDSFNHSQESKLKMSKSKLGFKHTDETKIKISKNNSRHMLGKTHTDESKMKIGLAGTGRKKSPETIEKLKQIMHNSTNPAHMKGVKKSPEQNIRASNGLKLKWQDPTFRENMLTVRKRQMTDEVKKQISTTKKQQFLQNGHNQARRWPSFVDPDGNIYDDILDMTRFAKLHNLTASVMRQVAYGDKKSHKGWRLHVT